ncbi:MAG: hypothetical protein ABEK01_05430 [Candidatus Nanohaloarchaea archaeon]
MESPQSAAYEATRDLNTYRVVQAYANLEDYEDLLTGMDEIPVPELVEETGLGRETAQKGLEPFEEAGLVHRENGKYVVDSEVSDEEIEEFAVEFEYFAERDYL